MSESKLELQSEPIIAVGLIQKAPTIQILLLDNFVSDRGHECPAGEVRVENRGGELIVQSSPELRGEHLLLTPVDPHNGRFQIQATIGIDFHWQQQETQVFPGSILLLAEEGGLVTLVNRVPLETYITSVICSEMHADSPAQSAQAHAIISRSWLLAQLQARQSGEQKGVADKPGQRIRWTDRSAHDRFDVCADDHCQRYQGLGRAQGVQVAQAVVHTRGQVLTHQGQACDARFSKCCGGMSEDFRSAWGDEQVPYLVPVLDGPMDMEPPGDLTEPDKLREFIEQPPDQAYCNCADDKVLSRVLNDYDRQTGDFFRWTVSLSAQEAQSLILEKIGTDLGRILALEPVQRGPSGRLVRLRLVGEKDSLILGKELEIRRALSPTHLYSSAFVIDPQGPSERPDFFVLHGAGWGHGVGLCQIGAAVMASRGLSCAEILKHYYPGAELTLLYR